MRAHHAGHRGFAGYSGWGWLNHGDDLNEHIDSSDILFTAKLAPAPVAGMAGLVGAGLMAARRRR